MANDLTFNQISSILNAITAQATGKTPLEIQNTSDFVAVGQTALLAGYDPVIQSISQVLQRTIFSIRPYNRLFSLINVTDSRWGNHVRKLQVVDKDFENDQRIPLIDGQSVDMYVVNKPDILQTNWYGGEVFQKHLTIFRDQLDSAFNNPDEFQSFITMIMTNASDQIEDAHEVMSKSTVANFITGKVKSNNESCIYLLDEYNAETGLSLTVTTVRQPDNFPGFIKWTFARIQNIADLMRQRSLLFHTNITDKPIMRHTPYNRSKLFLSSFLLNRISAEVRSDVFNNDYLKFAEYESVAVWQAISSPESINATPVYLNIDGTLTRETDAVELNNVVGLMFDEEALGIHTYSTWSAATPFNAAGGYTNMYWHFTDRYWNDFTENGVVFLMTKDAEVTKAAKK